MMEECGNKEHSDNNLDETDENLNNMNDNEVMCPDITSTSLMLEVEDRKHTDTLDNETET